MKIFNLILMSLVLGGCLNNNQIVAKNSHQNKQDIGDLEARVEKLNEQLEAELRAETSNASQIAELRLELRNSMVFLAEEMENKFNYLRLEINSAADTAMGNLEELSRLRTRLNEASLQTPTNLSVNDEALADITARLQQLETENLQMQSRMDAAIQAAEQRWQEDLTARLAANSGAMNAEIQEMVLREVERLVIEKMQTERELKNDEDDLEEDQLMNAVRNQLQSIEDRLSSLSEQEALQGHTDIANAIHQRTYAACYDDLAEDDYCMNQAAAIRRLGGVFVNPMNFNRDKAGLLSYLALSKVTLPSLINNIDAIITPSRSNRELFNRCMAQDGLELDHLIAPRAQWPRLIVLALVLEKAHASIEIQSENGSLGEFVSPVTHFVAWWRSECYQRGISTNMGDHVHGAALDLSFARQANQETFNFYRNFIEQHLWENDTFGIVHPLQAGNLTMRIGIGLGHGSLGRGKLHFGIYSEIPARSGNRSQWPYHDETHGEYTDMY